MEQQFLLLHKTIVLLLSETEQPGQMQALEVLLGQLVKGQFPLQGPPFFHSWLFSIDFSWAVLATPPKAILALSKRQWCLNTSQRLLGRVSVQPEEIPWDAKQK